MSLILRHKPEVINIELDRQGYADIEELINGVNKSGRKIDRGILDQIVTDDNKNRYAYNKDKTKIRANQGHSIKVDLGLVPVIPPKELYHGTSTKSYKKIMSEGITKRSREYVHLSDDKSTAKNVGKRHGDPVILKVRTERMVKDGYKFYKSKNNVWLTENVPSKYIYI